MKRIFILFVLFASCDLLTTRDPEKPDKPRSNFISPTTPEIVFQNLSNSFGDLVSENYIACFVDESFSDSKYHFIPSSGSVNQFPILSSWDKNSENQYFTNLVSQVSNNSKIILDFTNQEKQVFPDSILMKYNYLLTIPFNNTTNQYKGIGFFTLQLDQRNFWVITKWIDIKVENFLSWSELKGSYY